jgi:putative ABC transport system permease protein
MSETLIEYDDLLDGADHSRRNRLIGLAVLGVLIAAGAYALWAIALGGGGSSSAEIQTATVEQGSISQTLSTTGVAVAQSTANLSFEQAGTVSAVNVALGQEVKEGDVLAEIEADELQSALTAAEVNLASAQAQLDELLGAIAGISLVVGGIGIMNIMLVSVTERTREIGIRKAVGASSGDILLQFVVEAVIVTLVSGAAGVLAGVVAARVADGQDFGTGSSVTTVVAPWSIFVALGVSVLIGLFFGIYPAFRASRLNPIEALRAE